MTFGDYWAQYFEQKKLMVRETTLGAYYIMWDRHLKQVFPLYSSFLRFPSAAGGGRYPYCGRTTRSYRRGHDFEYIQPLG